MTREALGAAALAVLSVLFLLRRRARSGEHIPASPGQVRDVGPSERPSNDAAFEFEPDLIERTANAAERAFRWWELALGLLILGAVAYLAVTELITAIILALTACALWLIVWYSRVRTRRAVSRHFSGGEP